MFTYSMKRLNVSLIDSSLDFCRWFISSPREIFYITLLLPSVLLGNALISYKWDIPIDEVL